MKRQIQLLLSYVPRELPTGLTAHEVWANRIMDLTGPLADRASMKFVLANFLTSLGNTQSHKADQYFIRGLKVAAVKQVASYVFVQLKEQQTAEAAAKKLAEDTAQQATVTSDETQQKA